MTAQERNDFLHDLMKKAATQLGEHFDTVQIFCTHHEPAEQDGTIGHNTGLGNWYARDSQVREWIIQNDERVRAKTRRDIRRETEEGEEEE